MSFSGKLEDVRLHDLLVMIASRRRSGRLILRQEGAEGVILFREGRITAVVSSADPQTLGSLLLTEGHITEKDFFRALEVQRLATGEEGFARVLARLGVVPKQVLEDVVQRKVAGIVEHLLRWSDGFFEFVPGHLPDRGGVEIDAGQFVGQVTPDELPDSVSEDPSRVETGLPASFAVLPALPAVTGEATLEIIKAAESELERAVLFIVRHDGFRGIYRHGVGTGGAGGRDAPALELPLGEPSILRDAVERGEQVRGSLEENESNRLLVERLGGAWPAETVAIPVTAGGRALLVLYGDRLIGQSPIRAIPRVERVMLQVGVEIGNRLTASQRRQLDTLPAEESVDAPDGPFGGDWMARLVGKVDHLARQNETLIREFRAREQSLWHLAHHDPATGLPNRFVFWELLRKEIAHARQESNLLAVAVFDIDHFNDFNERFGEEFGDELLYEVSRRISSIVRDEDTLGRLGGDRWALVIPKGRRADDVMLVVRRVFDAFSEPLSVKKDQIRLSLSMGISIFPEDGGVPGELVRNAEVALKRAKDTGRNRFQVFTPAMNEWAQVRIELAQDLRRAVARSEDLSALFQPIVSVETGAIVGGEALLRWQPPERAPIQAHTLVELAEDTGLMPALGSWILHDACMRAARWQTGSMGIPVWVNVSMRQFQAGGLVESVMHALEEADLPPELLRLEITESIAAQNVPRIRDRLDRLHKLGVAVVLDDFGAGYSSLSYLMRYSAKGLKIDRSFVQGVPDSSQGCAVVDASIGLGLQLGLDVVAEGIEREEQLDFVRERGCPYVQGNLLSPPVAPERFQELLRDGVGARSMPGSRETPPESGPSRAPTPSTR